MNADVNAKVDGVTLTDEERKLVERMEQARTLRTATRMLVHQLLSTPLLLW